MDILSHLNLLDLCVSDVPNPVRLATAAALLLGALVGTRLMAGNRGWVRGLMVVAGLVTLGSAWVEKCKTPPLPPTVEEFRKMLVDEIERVKKQGKDMPGGASSTAPSAPQADTRNSPCDRLVFDGKGFPAPNFLAGPFGLTYEVMVRDIHDAACAPPFNLLIGVVVSKGTVENVRMIASPLNAAWGLYQADIKLFLEIATVADLALLGLPTTHQELAELRKKTDSLVVVRDMHLETVHIISNNPKIKSIQDLKGAKVAVPRTSQGSMVSAINLLRHFGVGTDGLQLAADAETAVAQVLRGTTLGDGTGVDALVITSGAPTPVLSAISAVPEAFRKHLHFVQVPAAGLPKTYRLEAVDQYPAWQSSFAKAPTVRALWVGWDFKKSASAMFKVRCEQTRLLKQVVGQSLPAWQGGSGHPAWKTLQPQAPVAGWPNSPC